MVDMSVGSWCFLAVVAFLAGIVDAVSGGGGLLTLPTYLLIGVPGHLISGTNITSSITGALIAAIRFAKGGKIHMQSAIVSGLVATAGGVLGAKLNLFIPEEAIEWVVMALVPIIAVVVLLKPAMGADNAIHTLSKRKILVSSLTIGFFLGIYNGFIGAGCGTFFLLAFAMVLKLDLVTASGNAKICGLFATIAAMVTYAMSGAVLWHMALFVTVFHTSGNYVGAGLALRKGAKIIRPMFILALLLLSVRMAYSIFV